MSQTILVTGASSGIGKASATLFADRGWNVVATMRNTDDGAAFAGRDNVLVTALDLLDSERSLLNFELAYWRAARDYRQAAARLETLVGGPIR